jgi:amidohydrolase
MATDWQEQLDLALERRYDRMIGLRRHLHRQPEPSGEEFKTSLHIYRLLDEEGFDVRMGPEGRGVIADFHGGDGRPARRIALRADVDALRIQDQKEVEYRSHVPGVMHACGHDAHSSIVWGAIGALRDLQQSGKLPWPVRYRGIFQPSEETSTGAKEMIDAGALEDVAAIAAVHVDPSRPVGSIGLREGVLTANCVGMRIRIVGRGGHTARPHEASDPIAAAAQLINSLYLFIPRVVDSQDAVVLGIGQINSGDNPNVIPERLELKGTLRTLDGRVHKESVQHVRRLAHGVAQTTDTQIDVQFERASGAVRNDPHMVALIERAAREVLGSEGIQYIARASMGSEDFAFYLDRVPGAMLRLGVASQHVGRSALHTPNFDVDERALAHGARILARTAVLWSEPDPAAVGPDPERQTQTPHNTPVPERPS